MMIASDCGNSLFKVSYHGHIVTGDRRIAKGIKLKKLFAKDPKYLEPKKTNFSQARENIINVIKKCILTWIHEHGIPDAVLVEWKAKVRKLLNNRITALKAQNNNNHTTETSSLKTAFLKNSLQHLHDQFVAAPVDKANENDTLSLVGQAIVIFQDPKLSLKILY